MLPLEQGHTYRARLELSGLYALAGAGDVRQAFEQKGFSAVHVYGKRPADWTEPNAQGPADWYIEGTWGGASRSVDTAADRNVKWLATWDVTPAAAPAPAPAPQPLPAPGPGWLSPGATAAAARAVASSSAEHAGGVVNASGVDVFPTWVGWEDVRAKARQIDASVEGLDAEQQASSRVVDSWRTPWQEWRKGWREFHQTVRDADVFRGDLNAKSALAQAESYERDLESWRASLARQLGQQPNTPSPSPLPGRADEKTDWGPVAFWGLLGLGLAYIVGKKL